MLQLVTLSGINDGAAAIVVMSEEKAKELGVTPMATWVAGALGGVEPEIMGVGILLLLQRKFLQRPVFLSMISI